jgi:flagellar hook assembly protein FlgD
VNLKRYKKHMAKLNDTNIYGDLGVIGDITVDGVIYQDNTYAEIYVADGSTAQTIATGSTYATSTAFTTNGASNNCTADADNDKITVTKSGKYKISAHFSGQVDTANTEFDGAILVDGVVQDNIKCYVEFIAANKNYSSAITGIADLEADEDVAFGIRHDDGGNVDITIVNANLNITYIGE